MFKLTVFLYVEISIINKSIKLQSGNRFVCRINGASVVKTLKVEEKNRIRIL